MSRLLALFFLCCLVFTAGQAEAAPPFRDLSPNHWAYNDITALTEKGIIGGYEDGTVRPNQPVTREELAKIVFTLYPQAMKSLLEETQNVGVPDYPDIYERWSSPYLQAASYLLPGYTDGLFKPAAPAKRRDVVLLLLYANLVEDGLWQVNEGRLYILLPVPEKEAWNQLQHFQEYADLEKIYRESPRYLENDPQKNNFTANAGLFFSQLNNIALLVEEQVIRGYEDGSLRLNNRVTRAETCALAKRVSQLHFNEREKFLLEAPALAAVPNTVQCNKSEAHTKLAQLGNWYLERYRDPVQRAKTLYDFLVYNFDYYWDYRWKMSSLPPDELEHTLATGTGIYTNFAKLYAQLAKYAGIEAAIITGQAENPTDSGPHAWVELTAGGKTISVDPTYGVCTGKYYFNNFNCWQEEGYDWIEQARRKI